MSKFKIFKVATRSTNANSFGLYGHILIAKDGSAYEVARSIGIWHADWPRGKELKLPLLPTGDVNWYAQGIELPRKLNRAPKKVVKEVWAVDLPATVP